MRAVIERAPLLAALARIKGVVETKTIIPILSNVCVTLEAGRVVLRATDLDMEAIEIVAASVDEPGKVSVPADKLFDIARNADPGAQITLSTEKGNPRVIVQSGRSRFQLPTLSAEDFPTFPVDDLPQPWVFPGKLLADMVSRVAFSRSVGSVLTSISGICITRVDDDLHVVACSSAGIALRRERAPEGADISVVVLSKFTNQLIRWLGDFEGDAQISSSDRLLRVVAGNSTLTTKVYDGPYADYRRLLLETHEQTAATDQDALDAAVRRVMIMGDQKATSVRIGFEEGAITLATRGTDLGEGADELAADFTGPETSFLLRADQLQAALASLKGDGVELMFASAIEPNVPSSGQVVIRAPSDPNMIINLMTMRV